MAVLVNHLGFEMDSSAPQRRFSGLTTVVNFLVRADLSFAL